MCVELNNNKDNKDNKPTYLGETLYEWRLKDVEERSRTNAKNLEESNRRINALEKSNAELKVYIANTLEAVQDISGDFKELDKLSGKRHQTQQDRWTDFFQKITYLVIGAIITYVFSQFM